MDQCQTFTTIFLSEDNKFWNEIHIFCKVVIVYTKQLCVGDFRYALEEEGEEKEDDKYLIKVCLIVLVKWSVGKVTKSTIQMMINQTLMLNFQLTEHVNFNILLAKE